MVFNFDFRTLNYFELSTLDKVCWREKIKLMNVAKIFLTKI